MTEREETIWKQAMEKAIAEATHESEIQVRAMIYYRAAVIGLGIGPAWDHKRTNGDVEKP